MVAREEFLLAVKIMMDERHVDPRIRRNAAERNAAESAFCKGNSRCSENLSTGVAVARTPS
jgi:hypothetical protein